MHRTSIQHAILALTLLTPAIAHPQWELQTSNTQASLRGIHNVGGGVAWASGTDGTVLRTQDGGHLWQGCATPPGAEHLDFRGIQAFDENTAIVMSSGPGDQSRLYKTTDGCRTWKLLFTNPDKKGFWDALLMVDPQRGIVLGDPAPADPRDPIVPPLTFRLRLTFNGGETWTPVIFPAARSPKDPSLDPLKGEGFFAASNSSATFADGQLFLATGKSRILHTKVGPSEFLPAACSGMIDPLSMSCGTTWPGWEVISAPVIHTSEAAGIFSIASGSNQTLLVVGGDYRHPALLTKVAAYSADAGQHWIAAQTTPHGYRSSVAYDPTVKTWITVGPNGSDFSTDDGRNWRPLTPNPEDQPGSDRDWNALSLPFVVGPHGRIGRLRSNALPGQPAPATPTLKPSSAAAKPAASTPLP